MGCGASVPCNILHKTNTAAALGAAILIQRWFRRHQARLEVRRRTAWRIFHRIELADEADQLRLYNFFGSLIDQVKQTEMAEETKKIGDSTVWKLETPTKKNRWMNCSASLPPEVPPTYTGPQLSFPITPPQAAALLIAFKNNQLHWLLALQLLREGRRKLYQEPGVRQATTNYPGHLTVCGDLHGQLEDLLLIFHKNGLPSPERKYIFNGDFVDRGGRSLELLLTLLRVYERDPHQVQDNLGTLATGMKFLNAGSHVAYAATRLFASLPLATVVNRRVLVLHGGLSSNIRLRALHSLPRHQFLSVLRPPVQMDEKGQVSTKFRDWKQLMAVLWSDPTPKAGESDNLARGGGCCFGPDVTLSVLRHHNLSLLIRSHECVPRGFAYQHGNMVLTVFSASNYFAPGSNLGAYVCLGYDLVPNCVQFQTGRQNLCPSSPHQCVSLVEQDAVKALREKLFTHRPQLTAAFMERDPQCTDVQADGEVYRLKKADKGEARAAEQDLRTWAPNGVLCSILNLRSSCPTGILHVGTWAEAVGSVLGLDLPWRRLRQHLALPAPGGGVYYHSCFQDLSLPQFNNTAESSLIEKLYSHKKHLETVFHLLDQDHSGLLSFAEFRTAWRLALSSQPGLSTNDNEEQVLKLAQSVDFNRDGAIDFNEFLEAFRLLDSRFTHPSTTNTLTHGKACTSHLEKQTNKAELE